MKSGVYTITNKINNKIYVGCSLDINLRLRQHYNKLINNKHNSRYLQRSVNVYGINNFIFEVLEYYTPDLIYSMEHYWCNILNTHDKNFGYNIQNTSHDNKSKHSEDTKKLMSDTAKNKNQKPSLEAFELSQIKLRKPIIQYDLSGNELNSFISVSEAARFLKCSRAKIVLVLSNKRKKLRNWKFSYN